MKRKGDIFPAARGNAKWRGAAWSLPWWWISGRWFGAQCHGGGKVGERITLMVFARLPPCSVEKIGEMEIVRLWAEMLEKVESKWLKGGNFA